MLDETPSAVPPAQESGAGIRRGTLKKLKFSAPKNHREVLQSPSFSHLDSLWQHNIGPRQSAGAKIGDINLDTLKDSARQDVLRLAIDYAQLYGGYCRPAENDLIVMAGHQPTLFHPGVWYKNFVLTELSKRFGCTSINFIVDNDICSVASLASPQGPTTKPRLKLVPFDAPAENIPFEERQIEDSEVFHSFGKNAADSIRPFVEKPISERLWSEVLEAKTLLTEHGQCNLGNAIAAGRHRYESKLGLRNLELPLSWIAETDSFMTFALHLWANRERFLEIYNASLAEYRKLYRIRSHSHPVPELAMQDQWCETPFWIWKSENPLRSQLFVRQLGNAVLLSNLKDWQTELKNQTAQDVLNQLGAEEVKIRPRALITTMYCRLVLSDLFVHGIGGAKYDQLTDLIADRFFDLTLPEFCTVSATMQLPTGVWPVKQQDLVDAKQLLRQFEFHAEKFIDTAKYPDAVSLIDDKQTLVRQAVTKEQAKAHRDNIANLDSQLQTFVEPRKEELLQQIDDITEQLEANQILGSREYSFCLFPENLVDSLRELARIPEQST